MRLLDGEQRKGRGLALLASLISTLNLTASALEPGHTKNVTFMRITEKKTLQKHETIFIHLITYNLQPNPTLATIVT